MTTISYSDMTVEQLRDAGYAVCLFTPEECCGVRTKYIEERMCEAGFDVIEYMGDHLDEAQS